MMRSITFMAFYSVFGAANATDWVIPDPVTYEWTVQQLRHEIPKIEFEETSIGRVIELINQSDGIPVRLKHDFTEDVLDKKVNWSFRDILWIDFVAKIADVADAEIVIGKRVVTLKQRRITEQDVRDDAR